MSTTKLTKHQNQQITETLCRMAAKGMQPSDIKEARRTLVLECEELNLATRKDAFAPEYIPRTATEAGYGGPLTGTGNAGRSFVPHTAMTETEATGYAKTATGPGY